MNRLLLLVLAIGLLATTSCERAPTPPLPPKVLRPLRFGMIPFNDLPILYETSETVSAYLSRHLKREVQFVLVPDYESVTALLKRGALDLAWLTPITYMRCRDQVDYELLCSPSRRGELSYRGIIVSRRDGPIAQLEDLRGKRFAYVDRHSASGFVYPNLLLRSRQIEPLEFFGEIHFSNNHTTSLKGLFTGLWDGAAVYEGSPEVAARGIDPKKVRVLARTAPIPTEPILVHRKLSVDLRKRLEELFVNMERHEGGKEALARLKKNDAIDRFVAPGKGALPLVDKP